MTYLSIDFETASEAELKKVGGYKYAADPSTFVWCMAWAIGDAEPGLWTPADPLPPAVLGHIVAGGPIRGWNVAFERLIWREIMVPRHGAPKVPLEQWHDTQAAAQAQGLPGSLDASAKALFGKDSDYLKDQPGKVLCTRMSKPRKPTKSNPSLWWDDAEKLKDLYKYCRQDVRVEREIARHVRPLPDTERELYLLTERMNDRGLPIDIALVNACGRRVKVAQEGAAERIAEITEGAITAPTQTAKIATYLGLSSIAKEILEVYETDDPVKAEVAAIRLAAGGAAVRKLSRIKAVTMEDGRARGQLRYHGAGPGRWSAQGGIQVQNLKRPDPDFDIEGNIERLLAGEALDESAFLVVPNLLRSCIVAPEGKALGALDYSQIEARLVAWFADQHDLLELFRSGGLVYETMAAQLYGVPVEGVTKDQRFWGKTLILGAGYQLGADRLKRQTRLAGREQPLSWCKTAIDTYRSTYRRIRNLWYALQDAALRAVENPGEWVPVCRGKVHFFRTDQWLYMRVPSGRYLSFHRPRVDVGRFGKPAVYYWGREQKTRQWVEVQGYGGRWTQNLCEAAGRDLMAGALLRFEAAGFLPRLTVHDEAVVECDPDQDYGELDYIMLAKETWADGLPVAAEGGIMGRYGK